MSKQFFKSVYFSDFPATGPKRKSLKIAISASEPFLHEAMEGLSSCEMRELLSVGSYADLSARASQVKQSVNAYCVDAVRRRLVRESSSQLSIFNPGDLGRHCTAASVRHLPVHRWFSWLEGYSPVFVEEILREFAPNAHRILDPFAGSGTTPLTGARLGRASYYCEINPLLQLVIRAKTLAFTVSRKRRPNLVASLRQLSRDLPKKVDSATVDVSLDQTYQNVFGKSQVFASKGYACVLKMRTLLDEISGLDTEAGSLFAVAILGAMLPSSLLTRAGDVRFRRAAELEEMTDLVDATRRQLEIMADDLELTEDSRTIPVFLTSDARNLDKLPAMDLDAVVTSPPYLNGTNYFRNTKLELWFLRALRKPSDLRSFRLQSVTAGINDVTVGRETSQHDVVLDLVSTLKTKAYDMRIPMMVGTYFSDMERVLSSIRTHLVRSSPLVLDIGDSVYAGIRVPTDKILTEIAESLGFTLLETRPLRNRVSRDKTTLRQVLLVFEWNGSTARHSKRSQWTGSADWKRFINEEPHQQAPYAARNWGHTLHSLCSYQGKLKPALAHHLVKAFLHPGDSVLDPFGGVGTIPLEAALGGMRAFSFDISPAAHSIARAKLAKPDVNGVWGVVDRLEDFLSRSSPTGEDLTRADEIRFNKPLSHYFHQQTLLEIIGARRFFLEVADSTSDADFVRAALLHILHGNRPYALSRRSHPITPFAPSGPFEYKGLIQKLRAKLLRALAEPLPELYRAGEAFMCDATEPWPQEIPELDAIITSPPFFDSTRFYLANWIRLWFSGWDAETFRHAPTRFVDERQKKGFSVYEPVFRQAREKLKPGAPLVMHLGRSKKCDMAFEIARVAKPWFTVADHYSESVRHCESHGIRDKGTVTDHEVLILA